MCLWIKCLLLCLMVFGFGCSEDKLSEDLEPELTRVMKGIRFEYPQTYIPRGLNAEFKVYAIYNDLTEEELSNSDLIGNYTWSIETTDTITLSNLATTPRVVSFIGIGDVELTLDYQRNGETFSFNQTFEISTPVIASIAVEEILGSSELIDGLCCSQIADTESSMVKGCVRRFKAIATYDNGDEEDQTSDLLTWESTTNFAEPVEIANLDGYEQINSCISSISESTKGVFFAKETGYFAVSASYSGITGTSSSIEVIEPTVLSIEFDSNNPTEVIEDSKARFSVIGTLNNDTTADIDDIAWSTSNSEKGVFLSSNANGTLTSLDDDDLVDDPIIITATHFTVGSINSPVTIREKVLTFVSIEHKDEEVDLIWNEKKQFQLRAFYNNENNYLLTSGVNWTVDRPEFAEIDSEGILTAGKVTASSEWLRVTGSYQDASDDMLIKVSNSSGELINFYTTPNDLKLIENYFTPVSIVGYFSNQTQQILPSDQFIITNKSGNFDVTRDGDNFLITAHPVDTNQSVSYSAEFQLEGTSQTTQLTISDVYDIQVDSLEIIKDADLVLENTQVQLSIVPTFIGDETNSPSVNKDTVSWSCSPSCSVENGIFTAPAFDATSDATSDIFTITALVKNSDFSNQIKDISADTTIKVQKTPTVYFEKAAEITNESDTTIEVTITSSTTALKDIVVPFFIVDASSDASLTKDYKVLSSPYQAIINEGSDSAVFDIEIMDDNDVESDESIFLMIGPSVVNAAIGSQNTYELEITANDDAKVSFATGSQRKREDSGVVSIKIEQDVIHYEDVIIGYEVDDFPDCQIPNVRTAKKDYDYLTSTLTGTATIPSGSLSTTIQFHISDDSFHETDECLALRLTNVEPQRVDLGTIVSHVVTIEDDDNLVITSQHNPDNKEINNTGTYTYTANITPFDGTSDNWKFNVYNEPAGSVVLTDDVNQSLSLSWETDKHDVGLLDNKIIICVSDIDASGDYSLAPGAQTMCQPFNIEVLTCRLNGAFGDINTASDFLGLYCGGPDNHITVSNGKSLNMGVGQDFGGIVIIEPGGKFHVTDGTIDSSADVILSGKLESTGTSLINGLLDTSGDATIGINSNGSLTYNHSSLLLDGVQLTLDLQGSGARLINENPIDLNSDNSRLLIQSSGLGNSVKHIKVTSAQGGSSEYIQVTGDVSVDALTFQADSFLKIESGGTLAITGDTDLSGDVALTVDSGGNLVFNREFNHDSNRPITIQENSTLIPRFNFTLSGDLHLYGGGKLDLSTTNLFLDHNLETSGGILITTIDQTILNLRKPASINANQRLMLNQLLLGDHKLTLGSETSGMDVSVDVVINGNNAGIDAVNGQDLKFHASLSLSSGAQMDSSGDGSVNIAGDLDIVAGSFIADGTADIGGMITMSEGDFSVNNGNAYLNGGNITSGNFNVSDSVVYLKNDLAINTENLIQTDLTQWYLQPESSLSLGGSSLLIFGGSLQIATGAGLVINNSSNPFLTGPVTVSQGKITLSDNATFTNSITIDGSADILIPQNKDLTYQHADPIIIGSENLRIYGGGILDNASGGAVLFGSGSGTLILGDGSSGLTELRRLDVSAIMSPPARIELKSDFLITDIETSSDIDIQTNGSDLTLKNLGIWEDLSISGFDPADFYVETIDLNNKTLSFGDNLNVNSGNLFFNGAGRLDGKLLNINANSETTFVDITADGIDFEIDESTLFFSGRNSFVNGAFSVNNSSIHVDGDLLLTPASSSNMRAVWDISADSILSWNGIGTMAGSIILGADSNLSLHNNRSSISAQISLNGNAGIHIGSGGLEYSGGPITLTHQLSLFGGDFDNSSDHKIIVGDNGSILLNQSSGTIDFVNLNSSQHSSNHIVVNADYEVLDLSLNNDSNIYIGSGNTLTVSNILDIPTGIKLTITGGGRLILNGGLNLGDGSQLKTEGSSILQIEGEVNIGNGAQIDLSGGALDLKDKSVHLKSNWTINTNSLTTNLGTDISTDTHELVWEARSGQEFNGTISIGDGQSGNSGRFTVFGQPAEISANIYLYGGTLDIDVTTDVSGQIFHKASSAIDITSDATLNYTVHPLLVEEHVLTLKGGGDFNNINFLSLDQIQSILNLDTDGGMLAKVSVDESTKIRVQEAKSYAIDSLNLNNSLVVDISSDSLLQVQDPVLIPGSESLSVLGGGVVEFSQLTVPDSSSYSQGNDVKSVVSGLSLDGQFDARNSRVELKGDSTGDGDLQLSGSVIDILTNTRLLLDPGADLSSDSSIWNISGGMLTWNGIGGNFKGAVDISSDGIFYLFDNPAEFEADFSLQGSLVTDATADIHNLILTPNTTPAIEVTNDSRIKIRTSPSIPSSTALTITGNGVTEWNGFTIEATGSITATGTYLESYDDIILNGTLELNNSNLNLSGGLNPLSGSGNLILTSSNVVASTTIDLYANVLADASSDWIIDNASTTTWITPGNISFRQISIGDGSELNLGTENRTIQANILLHNSKLTVDATSDFQGNFGLGISDGTADISVTSGATMSYQGEDFTLDGNTLILSGGGVINNGLSGSEKWFLLDDPKSALLLSGNNGRLANVKVDGDGSDRRIEASADYTIDNLVLEAPGTPYEFYIYIGDSRELTIDSSLDIPSGVTLTIQGKGSLKLNNDLIVDGQIDVVDGGSIFVDGNLSITGAMSVNEGVLDLNGELNLDGNLLFNGGNIDLPDTGTTDISGTGRLDLRDVDLDLTNNVSITTELITDVSTDIDTGSYTLEWRYDGSHPFRGKIKIDEGGTFRIKDNEADVSADIHLNGGTLEIDETTNLSGNIYHKASSTIDILQNKYLNYSGNDISVDALTLTMAGDGTMANSNAIVLNATNSILTLSNDGIVQQIHASSGNGNRINVREDATVSQLLINNPLVVDTSPDASLYLESDLEVFSPATFTATGEGQIQLKAIKTDSTFDVTSTDGLVLSGNVDVSGDGILDVSGTPINLSGIGDIYFTGSGGLNVQSSPIAVNTNLYLEMSGSGDISSDTFTQWLIGGEIFSWNGVGGKLKGKIDLSADATLIIHDNPAIIDASIDIYQGHIDIDTTTDIFGGVTTYPGFDASMDVQSGTTVNITNPFVISSTNFMLSGNGNLISDGLSIQGNTQVNGSRLIITNDLTVNQPFGMNGGLLVLSGDATAIAGTGTISLSGVSVDIFSDIEISAVISSDTLTDWDFNGRVITWNSGSSIYGSHLSLGTNGLLQINDSIIVDSPLDLSGATLGIPRDVGLTGNISALTDDATIDVSADAYLDYTGSNLLIGDKSLVLSGSGVIDNTSDIVLSNGQSDLYLSGQDGMLHKAKFGADSLPDHGIIVEEDYVIRQLTLGGVAGRIKVDTNTTLIIGDQLIAQNGTNKLIKDPSNDGTIILHEVILEGHLEIGEGFALAPDATLYVKQNATLTVNSDLYFNDGIIVDDGAVLTITGGDHTVTFAGGYNLSGSGQVDVSGDVNVEIESSQVDLSELSRTGKPGTGTINPSKNGALDVLSFSATSKNQEIDLKWVFQDDTYKHVRIIRSANGYPDATSDPTLVYDGISDNYTDGVQNGISFYYTAFAHDGSGDYAPGVHAMASATIIPDGLIGYYMLGAEDCTNDLLLDSCGLGSHGLCQGSLNPVQDATGDPTGALEFNGIESSAEIDNPYLEVSSIDSDTTADDFTISFWIRTSQTGGDPSADWFDNSNFPIIDGKIGVDQNDFGLALANRRIVFGIGFGNSTFNIVSKTIDADWHHIAVTRDYNTGLMQLYLDGKLDATGDGPIHADLNSPSFLGIGRSPFGNTYFEGRLDDIRFYNRVLIESEIESLYENTP